MTNPQKRAGVAFESALRDELNRRLAAAGHSARAVRVSQTGAQDVGDLHLGDWTLQAKAYASVGDGILAGLHDVEAQRIAAGKSHGAVIAKVRGRGASGSVVALTLDEFIRLILEDR